MTGLSARGQQVDEADEVAQLLYVRLQREDLFAVLAWLVHDAGQLVVVLHHVLHHVRLVALQRQPESLHLDDGVEQVEVVGTSVLLKLADQVHNRLDLLRKNLQTRALVADERLYVNNKHMQ